MAGQEPNKPCRNASQERASNVVPTGPKLPGQQYKKPATESSNSSSTPKARKKRYILNYTALDKAILTKEFQRKDKAGKTVRYFDGYNTLKSKLQTTKGQNPTTSHTPLAKLQILEGAKGKDNKPLCFDELLWDTIKYLLDFDAEKKPPIRVNKQPEFCSSELWNGELWLGGLSDSGNWDGFLCRDKCNIKAVVSVHPDDDLAKSYWKGLYEQWNGKSESLKEGWTHGKIGQYSMPLLDESGSDMYSYLDKMFEFIEWHHSRGENVYIHCKAGQSRSGSAAVGYMRHRAEKSTCLHADLQPLDQTLGIVLDKFTDEISLRQGEDKSNAIQDKIHVKREGVNIETFKPQLLKYFRQQGKGSTSQSDDQAEPAKKKGNGGYIIIVAAMIECFVLDLKPTTELKEYWFELRSNVKKIQGQKKRLLVASKDKDEKEGITKEKSDEQRLAEYDVLFDYKPRAPEESESKKSSPKK